LEDGSSFFLSIDFFISKKLAKGVTVNQELLSEIKEESLFVEAYIKAISLLSRQLYTRFKLKTKLISKGFDICGVEKSLEFLEEQGYINDKVYAEKWVSSRIRNKLDSYNILLAGLMNKGINASICKDVLNELYTEEVNELIIEKSIIKQLKLNK
jgi:regulatory protein